MTSRVEAITQEIFRKLTDPGMQSIPPDSVFRNLNSALNNQLPALILEEGDELTPDLSIMSIAHRRLNVRLLVLIKGEQPYQSADQLLIDAYDIIMSDRSVNGLALDVTEGATKRERRLLEKPVAIITKNFLIQFRTAENSLL